MLHKRKVAAALWGIAKRQVRIFLSLDWLRAFRCLPHHQQVRFFPTDHTKLSLDAVWPRLRKQAQAIPREELAVLEAVVVARKG